MFEETGGERDGEDVPGEKPDFKRPRGRDAFRS